MKKLLMVAGAALLGLVACSGGNGDTASSFCDAALSFVEVQTEASTAMSPEEQRDVYEKVVTASQDVAESAPDEIKEGAQTLATVAEKVRDALDSVDYDATKLTQEQQEELAPPETTKLLTEVMTYMTENCEDVADQLDAPSDEMSTSEPVPSS